MSTAAAGFSATRLQRLHDVLAGYVERGEVAGLVALVCRHGATHAEVLGRQAFDGAPMRRDSIFRVSSMSKPVTAVATLSLVEECLLRLDEPVDRLLPELAERRVLRSLDAPLDETVPAERPLTVRDLLTFRMGFGQLLAPPDAFPILRAANELQLGMGPPNPAAMPPPDEWLRRLGSLPLMCQPGERWLYNTGSDVLGVLIEHAAGKPFEAVLRERVFEPLGMADSGFWVPPAALDRFTDSYWTDPAGGAQMLYDPAAGGQWSSAPAFLSGAAGLVATADDFLAFGRMLLAGGALDGRRILSRPTVQLMTTDQLTPAQKAAEGLVAGYFDNHGWGFGLSVVTRRDEIGASPGRYGWDGGLGTSWFNDPAEDLVAILMTSSAWTSPSPPGICRDFWTLAYAAIDD